MRPARKGDGTGLSFPGYSEVRTGDGTVLWSAGPDIPDSGDLHAHYDATGITASDGDEVTSWLDETTNGRDLSGSGPTYISDGIGGNPSVRFDGQDDYLQTSFETLSQPNHYFVVFEFQSTSGSLPRVFTSKDSNNRNLFYIDNDYIYNAGSIANIKAADTAENIGSLLFDGGDSAARINGTQEHSGDVGTGGQNGLTLGANDDLTGNFAEVDIAELLIYPMDKSDIVDEVEQYLGDKWNISL